MTDPMVVITGAARGVGKAVAGRFRESGAEPFLIDIRADELAGTAKELGCGHCVADLSSVDECTRAAEQALAHGPVSVLVNNGAIAPVGDIFHTNVAVWDQAFAVNVRAAFILCKFLLPSIAEHPGGSVVNVASAAGLTGQGDSLAYCASKAAVVNFTRALALDLAPQQIRVNCVCPGSIDTPLLEEFYSALSDPAAARTADLAAYPMGRIATPAEIADAIFFLASERASFMTGSALVVDGGFLAR